MLRTWWRSESSAAFLVLLATAVVLASIPATTALAGFDLLNTVDYEGAPIRVPLNIVVASVYALLTARAWFGSSEVQREQFRFRQQFGLGAWLVRGLLGIALITAIATWAVSAMLDFGAQHLSGQDATVDATVLSLSRSHQSKTPCRFRLTVRLNSDGSTLTTCLKTTFRAALGPLDLAENDLVTLETRSTPLGRVVTRIYRRAQQEAEITSSPASQLEPSRR